MSEKVHVIIACLAEVAWADGKLLPAEADFFRQVIDALGLPPEEESRAWRAVVCPSDDVNEAQIALLSVADRDQILAMSHDMANCDSVMSDEERDAIERLRRSFSRELRGTEASGA